MSQSESLDILAEVYGDWLRRQAADLPELLRAAVLHLLEAMAAGHVCVAVEGLDGLEHPWLGRAGDYRPLIFDAGRLYLARYFDHEQAVANSLRHRAEALAPIEDEALLRRALARLFTTELASDRQRLAVLVAQFKPLTLISGGPGTGKTSTVVNLLALLLARRPQLRIALAAPTGKAAQRLSGAIATAKQYLNADAEINALIPEVATTLHRLLGALGDSGRYRHDRENPLAYDMLVVDEASMIDLAMMRAVLDALPESAGLVLLGDKDQLASVEAGSVFGDICALQGMSADFLERLKPFGIEMPASPQVPALGNCRVELVHSYRFTADSGIGRLAAAARTGDEAAFMAVYAEAPADISWVSDAGLGDTCFAEQVQAGFADYLAAVEAQDVAGAFAALLRFRLLCAHRQGPLGVEGINRLVQQLLQLPAAQTWYAGRPVMISGNDYTLRLFNGDIGICMATSAGLRVFFEDEGGYRELIPARVPVHETAYAMTVHKSQGSEFDQVLLLLPEKMTPVLNRPLLYTAITRAKKQFCLWGSKAVVREMLAHLPERESGLAQRLA